MESPQTFSLDVIMKIASRIDCTDYCNQAEAK